MPFKHNHGYSNVLQVGMDMALFLPKVYDVFLGTPGASFGSVFSQGTESSNSIFSRDSLTPTFYASRTCMERTNYLQAMEVLAPRIRVFGTFIPANENVGGSAICIHKDLLTEEAIVTHLVTCHGRDHLVKVSTWSTQPGDFQRSLRTGAFLETITWLIEYYSPALACISQWCGHYFG